MSNVFFNIIKEINNFKEKNFKLIDLIKDEANLLDYNIKVLQVEEVNLISNLRFI